MLRQLIFVSVCAALANQSGATTLWAACGEGVTLNADTLVVKNRDDLPAEQKIAEVIDEEGYRFKALLIGPKQRIDSGINEKGLFISYATVATIPRATRRNLSSSKFKSPEGWQTLEWVLRRCASVREALSNPAVFRGYPWTYVLADAKQVALIEALPNGRILVNKTDKGVLTHTNHYVDPAGVSANEKPSETSELRLARIQSLLDAAPKPFTKETFAEMTLDIEGGKDVAIFRSGDKPHLPKTLASIVVRIPAKGPAELRVRYLEHPETDMQAWTDFKGIYPSPVASDAPIVESGETVTAPQTTKTKDAQP